MMATFAFNTRIFFKEEGWQIWVKQAKIGSILTQVWFISFPLNCIG